jgi:hypothetical protein
MGQSRRIYDVQENIVANSSQNLVSILSKPDFIQLASDFDKDHKGTIGPIICGLAGRRRYKSAGGIKKSP